MNGSEDSQATPLLLQVTEPILWLERNDRHIEFHKTIEHLLNTQRVEEAVLCLEAYIGRTAPIRSQVKGWGHRDHPDGDTSAIDWPRAVHNLSRNRSRRDVRLIQHLLRATKSTPWGQA